MLPTGTFSSNPVTDTIVITSGTITISATALNLGTTTLGSSSTPQSYVVSGSNLTGDILIGPPSGVWLSKDGGVSFQAGLLTLPQIGGSVPSTTIEAMISPYAPVGPIGGQIINTCAGITEQDVLVSGMVNAAPPPTIKVNVATLSLGTTTFGTAGAKQSFHRRRHQFDCRYRDHVAFQRVVVPGRRP